MAQTSQLPTLSPATSTQLSESLNLRLPAHHLHVLIGVVLDRLSPSSLALYAPFVKALLHLVCVDALDEKSPSKRKSPSAEKDEEGETSPSPPPPPFPSSPSPPTLPKWTSAGPPPPISMFMLLDLAGCDEGVFQNFALTDLLSLCARDNLTGELERVLEYLVTSLAIIHYASGPTPIPLDLSAFEFGDEGTVPKLPYYDTALRVNIQTGENMRVATREQAALGLQFAEVITARNLKSFLTLSIPPSI